MSRATEEFGLIWVPAETERLVLIPIGSMVPISCYGEHHCGTYSPSVGVSLAGHVLPACDIGQYFEHMINKSVLKCLTPTVNLSFLACNWLRRNVRK